MDGPDLFGRWYLTCGAGQCGGAPARRSKAPETWRGKLHSSQTEKAKTKNDFKTINLLQPELNN